MLAGLTATAGLLLLGVSGTASAASAGMQASKTARPISDFVSTQGSIPLDEGPTLGGEFIVGKSFIWGNSLSQLFQVDYSGANAKALVSVGGPNPNTSFAGKIAEQRLPDGQALDTIQLKTTNALADMVNASTFPNNCSNGGRVTFIACPVIFGYSPIELANGIGRPLLVTSVLDVTLVNTAPGAPIPDLVTVLGNSPSDSVAYVKTLTLQTTAVGPLRSAFGVPDGTRGQGSLNVTFDISQSLDNEQTSLRMLGK